MLGQGESQALFTLSESQLASANALAKQFGSLKELLSARADSMGLRAFTDSVKQSSMGNVARALRGDGRTVPVEWLESYIEKTGDTSPVLYLIAKNIDPDEERLNQLLALVRRAHQTASIGNEN